MAARPSKGCATPDTGAKDHYRHNGHVIKTSLAHARAHLSELVDQAEHKNRRILILRHGKPAAAIVPVDVAVPKRRQARAMSWPISRR
jgi:prevent-host-death family protein